MHVASLASEPKLTELVVMTGESVEASKLVRDECIAVEDGWGIGVAARGGGGELLENSELGKDGCAVVEDP